MRSAAGGDVLTPLNTREAIIAAGRTVRLGSKTAKSAAFGAGSVQMLRGAVAEQ